MGRYLSFLCWFWVAIPFSAFAQEQIGTVFEEKFEGKLQDGWMWIRENASGKRFVDNALEIRMEPFADKEAKNVLLRKAPKREKTTPYTVELKFRCIKPFTNQYQQVGLFWVHDGTVIFKFVRELIDGQLYVFPGKIAVSGNELTLKVQVSGEDVIAEFMPEKGGSFQRVYEGKLPVASDGEQIGIQCWHGPKEKEEEHWVRFERFRISKQ